MAEGLASAVTLPDQDTIASSPETSLKRKSSITDPDTKRRRLSAHDDDHDRTSNRNDDEAGDCRRSSTGVGTEPAPVKTAEEEGDRKPKTTRPSAPGRRDDERKRGQRLFGGLLGTLSQSSTSTAQRRRADIERKQQEKLKLQDAEYGEVKKKRREDRMVIRKREQRVYEEESMRTRHSNLLAMARFLKTKTEPTLYYKPWELRPRDEDIIQDQIDDAEDLIAREVAEFEARNPPPSKEGGEEGGEEGQPTEKPEEAKEKPAEEPAPLPEPEPKKEKPNEPNEPNEPQKPEETTHEQASDMNVGTGGDQKPAEVTPGTDDTTTNGHDQNDAGHAPPPPVVPHDDGGEVVEEDNEDTIHGFPDLSMGWRYQIPMLLDMGLRVIAPDCLGYGRTDAPQDPAEYSHKRCADDIKELASQLGASKIIVGGHDWGAALAYRVALWHPELVTHVFTVCVPYAAPTRKYLSLEDFVSTIAPHFAYQLQFRSGELENAILSEEDIKKFLSALYGGRTEDREVGFDAQVGVLLENLSRLRPSRLLNEEELDYYAKEFSRNGLNGPLNWYRTREINYKDELALLNQRITAPVLFIQALRDTALPAHLGKGMTRTLPHLAFQQINTSHWALWEKPKEVNEIIAWWLEEVVFGDTRPRQYKL